MSEQHRMWRTGDLSSLRAPYDVAAVTDRNGRRWTRDGTGWTFTGDRWIGWRALIQQHGPVTDTPPTP